MSKVIFFPYKERQRRKSGLVLKGGIISEKSNYLCRRSHVSGGSLQAITDNPSIHGQAIVAHTTGVTHYCTDACLLCRTLHFSVCTSHLFQ